MNGDNTGLIIQTQRLKKIIYKLKKGIELDEAENKIVEKIIQAKEKKE